MNKFYNFENGFISGEDYQHIVKSLRMKIGDTIVLCDGQFDYISQITDIDKSKIFYNIIENKKIITEPNVKTTLYQCYPKVGKFETIVQKATELGVTRVVPVVSRYCNNVPNAESRGRKIVRCRKIAEAASKQSGRGVIPEIAEFMNFENAISECGNYDVNLFFYEMGGEKISDIPLKDAKNISLFVGSEGGFSEDEVQSADNIGCSRIHLGERILRCETAPVVALSLVMHLTGNL
jgi:16S rRNA (uracil1498-N3)-methyltransferase